MICTHLDFVAERYSVLIIIIEKENFARMKEGDPITLESAAKGGKVLQRVGFPENLSMVIAYSEDDVELYRICKSRNAVELLRYLESKRQWVPETDGEQNVVNFKGSAK